MQLIDVIAEEIERCRPELELLLGQMNRMEPLVNLVREDIHEESLESHVQPRPGACDSPTTTTVAQSQTPS